MKTKHELNEGCIRQAGRTKHGAPVGQLGQRMGQAGDESLVLEREAALHVCICWVQPPVDQQLQGEAAIAKPPYVR